MARIVTVYRGDRLEFLPTDMSIIRWLKISEALARAGHRVDIATNEPGMRRRHFAVSMGRNLRRVPLARVRWHRYDVVKTLFHVGFETLEHHGGAGHPFVISKLGSVVDHRDRDGIYFRGERRRGLYVVQERIAAQARYVTLLTEASRETWRANFGDRPETLLVPGAVDAQLCAPGRDPYESPPGTRCLFAGNVYDARSQPEARRTLVAKLNEVGSLLRDAGMTLTVMGPGDTRAIDRDVVTCIGPVPYERSWDRLRHADVGVVLALGPAPNENESTKIYHYLRAGLPTVCEAGFPNQDLVTRASLGTIAPNGDLRALATAVVDAAHGTWHRSTAVDFILRNHTWDDRARVYDRVIRVRAGAP